MTCTPLPRLCWPCREPDDVLDYAFDVSAALADVTDSVTSASVSIMPSGPGELTVSELSVAGGVATFWLSGGVAGRAYAVRIEVSTGGGRTFEWLPGIAVDPALATYPVPPPPDPGFGPALAWGPFASLDFSAVVNSGLFPLL
jgi:hypothetical protein